jgi:anti-sigma factor RsiW
MNGHPHDLLGAYADGELDAAETARVAGHLQQCTECARELALIRSMGGAMRTMVGTTEARDVWGGVHRRLTRPAGWLLVTGGIAVWCVMMVLEWFRHGELTWQWLASTAVGIGVALLLVGVLHEQYREWKETRYKDIMR